MKSLVWIVPFILLGASCKQENVGMYDRLTNDERTAIQNARYEKCLSDSAKNYEDFTEISNERMLDMVRDQSWKYEYKKDNSVIETSYINVWKISGGTVYFLMTLTEGGVTTNKFLKLSTTMNSEMIADLKEKKCRKTVTITDTSSSATAKVEEDRGSDDSDTYFIPTVTYSFDFNLPAYFGVRNLKREKKTYNEDTDAVTKTETFEYVMTARSNPPAQTSPYTTYNNRQYCTIKFTVGTPNTYTFPYDPDCKTDANIDPAAFDPATELVIP